MEKYTLITGACGGLGRAFVKMIASAGENLVLVGTSKSKLDDLIKENKEQFNSVKVLDFVCNLADEKDRLKLVNFIKEKNIQINKIINNAGVIIEGDMIKFEDDEILKAVEVNCVGTLDLTQKLIKMRDENEKFEVLTVSSLASSYPMPHMAVYAATKAFLTSMMTALAVEFKGKNVVICTVCPGGIPTTKEMKESIKSMGLGGRLSAASPEKVAKVALKGLKKKKKVVIVGGFNKFLAGISKIFSKSFMAVVVGNIWKKSQSKRKFWYDFIIFF